MSPSAEAQVNKEMSAAFRRIREFEEENAVLRAGSIAPVPRSDPLKK